MIRETFRPPPVLPALAPMNITSTSIAFENEGQRSKFVVAKPVVVITDETWKKAYLRAVQKDS